MQDKEIFRIATLTTVIGLIGLIVTSGFISPNIIEIDEIDNSKLDSQVEIQGVVTSLIVTKSGTTIIEVTDDTGSIDVVIFSTTNMDNSIYECVNVSVTGDVSIYNNQYEIILDNENNLKIL
ncbi:MAG: hypothetical protein LUG89_05980 [Methanosphaera sp.]|nr:hypothetical protein [Methanosphaera sp.]